MEGFMKERKMSKFRNVIVDGQMYVNWDDVVAALDNVNIDVKMIKGSK